MSDIELITANETLKGINLLLSRRLRAEQKKSLRLQQRLNEISNRMIGNERIWTLDRLAMELDLQADEAESTSRGNSHMKGKKEAWMEMARRLRADALFLRRLEWDLGELHTSVRGKTNRRGGRYETDYGRERP